MSAQKGSNGVEDGRKNVRDFLAWRNRTDDFKPYIWQGLLNQSRIAREAGFGRGVFDTNKEIRDVHYPALIAELEAQGVLQARVANPSDRPMESNGNPRRSTLELARIKQIQEEAEAVRAENRELRAQLAKLERLKVLDDIISTTGRMPY